MGKYIRIKIPHKNITILKKEPFKITPKVMKVYIVIEVNCGIDECDWNVIACLETEEEARNLVNKLEDYNPYGPEYYYKVMEVGEIIEDYKKFYYDKP